MDERTVSIIIAAYNEEPTIGRAIERVEAADLSALGLRKEILVVDDGSQDRTGELVRSHEPASRCFSHPANRGKGAAVQTALQATTGDFVIIQDTGLTDEATCYKAFRAGLLKYRFVPLGRFAPGRTG